jgi:formylglycine-generating enzyme required for sulfatase activity
MGHRIATGVFALLAALGPSCLSTGFGRIRTPDIPAPRLADEQLAAAKNLGVPATFINRAGIRFVLIPAGTFWMGRPESDDLRSPNEVRRRVTISKPFYLSTTEVTQQQYEAVTGHNPAFVKQQHGPVEQVSCIDVHERFLIPMSAGDGRVYRLPTEAEWEYACRAGSETRFCYGDDPRQLGEYAWFKGNSGHKSHPVARKKPNRWGLHDMHGNLWEWCTDWMDDYEPTPATDPYGERDAAKHKGEKAMRGGAFCYPEKHARSAQRNKDNIDHRHDIIGFRVLAEVGED